MIFNHTPQLNILPKVRGAGYLSIFDLDRKRSFSLL